MDFLSPAWNDIVEVSENDIGEIDESLNELLHKLEVFSLNEFSPRFQRLVNTINARLGRDFSQIPEVKK